MQCYISTPVLIVTEDIYNITHSHSFIINILMPHGSSGNNSHLTDECVCVCVKGGGGGGG